jgi:hypothetical protein
MRPSPSNLLGLIVGTVACGHGTPASPASPPASSCPTDRAVILASRADIARAASCTTLAGVMVRSGAALDTSALSALTTITGDLIIGPTVGIHDATFRELRIVDGALRVGGNGLLQGLFLPKLERAGSIAIDGNVALTTISLPRLTSVGGSFHITDNASLELVDIPTLQSIAHDFVITGAPQLTLIDASQLQAAASVKLEGSKLSPELADRLRAVSAPP